MEIICITTTGHFASFLLINENMIGTKVIQSVPHVQLIYNLHCQDYIILSRRSKEIQNRLLQSN